MAASTEYPVGHASTQAWSSSTCPAGQLKHDCGPPPLHVEQPASQLKHVFNPRNRRAYVPAGHSAVHVPAVGWKNADRPPAHDKQSSVLGPSHVAQPSEHGAHSQLDVA